MRVLRATMAASPEKATGWSVRYPSPINRANAQARLNSGMLGGYVERGSRPVWGLARDRDVQFRSELSDEGSNFVIRPKLTRRPKLPDRDTCHESGKRRELSFTRVRNCSRELQHLGGHAGADRGRLDLHAPHMNQPGQPCAEVREVFGDSGLRAHDSFASIDWLVALSANADRVRRGQMRVAAKIRNSPKSPASMRSGSHRARIAPKRAAGAPATAI